MPGVQSKAASPSAASPPENIDTLMCVRAQHIRKRHSLGVMRIHLSDLGISPLNRTISWKHVHYVLRQILTKEGFTIMRYHQALAIEPNPADSEEVWRHSKKVTDAAGDRLAPHPKNALLGVLWKNHLTLGLQILASDRSVPWDHNGLPVKTPSLSTNTQELHETLELGIWAERLRHAAVSEDEQAVRFFVLVGQH